MGGVDNWLWKGPEALQSIGIEVAIGYPYGGVLRHSIVLADRNGRPEVIDERVEPSESHTRLRQYRRRCRNQYLEKSGSYESIRSMLL